MTTATIAPAQAVNRGGRPPVDDPRTERAETRLTRGERAAVDELRRRLGTPSDAELLRELLRRECAGAGVTMP